MQKPHKLIFLVCFVILLLISFIFNHVKKEKLVDIQNIYTFSEVDFNHLKFDVAKVETKNISSIQFYSKYTYNQDSLQIDSLKYSLQDQKKELLFATNGGIFSPQFTPLGLYIENGKVISDINLNIGEGNFYLQPNGVFLLKRNNAQITESQEYTYASDIDFGLQSGPMLVSNNTINPLFNRDSQNKYIRSGVGIDNEGNIFFALSNTPVTFYEFASFFKDHLGCPEALYLDGAISEMYIPKIRENMRENFSVIIGIVKE